MSDSIAMIRAALQADAEVVRLIAQNVANANTPGYRRAVPTIAAPAETGAVLGGQPHAVAIGDFTAGTLTSTGAPLDLGIEGPGFFVVAGPAGEELTRRGDFRIAADGNLVTQLGDPVLGERGPIALGGGTVTVAADGTVSVDGAAVDRLRLVELGAASALVPTERGNYALNAGDALPGSSASRLRQGFLESSNVAPVNEMIRLMEAVRHFETAQRFARGYDDMLNLAISELGRP